VTDFNGAMVLKGT